MAGRDSPIETPPAGPTPSRVFAKWAAVIVFNLILLEVGSFGLVYLVGVVRPEFRLDHFLDVRFSGIDGAYLQKYHARHDPLLGWDNKPNTVVTSQNVLDKAWTSTFGPDGARADGRDDWPLLVASYGESHTECQEVSPQQTWQYFAEEPLQGNIKNFGVGGFGPGQALLKLQRHLDDGLVAPITVLCIHEENINRVVNRYRPFYSPGTKGKLAFKPAFRFRRGTLEFLPNPVPDTMRTVAELKDLAHQVARDDHWASTRLWLVPEFPHVHQAFRVVRHLYRRAAGRATGRPVLPRLWRTTEGNRLMDHLVAQFREVTLANHSTPILMLLPHTQEWKDGRAAPAYTAFASRIRSRFPDLHVIDISELQFEEERFNVLPYRGHVSEYGNRLIAERLVQEILRLPDLERLRSKAPATAG